MINNEEFMCLTTYIYIYIRIFICIYVYIMITIYNLINVWFEKNDIHFFLLRSFSINLKNTATGIIHLPKMSNNEEKCFFDECRDVIIRIKFLECQITEHEVEVPTHKNELLKMQRDHDS